MNNVVSMPSEIPYHLFSLEDVLEVLVMYQMSGIHDKNQLLVNYILFYLLKFFPWEEGGGGGGSHFIPSIF